MLLLIMLGLSIFLFHNNHARVHVLLHPNIFRTMSLKTLVRFPSHRVIFFVLLHQFDRNNDISLSLLRTKPFSLLSGRGPCCSTSPLIGFWLAGVCPYARCEFVLSTASLRVKIFFLLPWLYSIWVFRASCE